jgi:hypothetical protein
MEIKLAELTDDNAALRAKLSLTMGDNDTLRGTVDALKTELRRKEELALRTEGSLTAAERDHVRTQEDLRAALGRITLLQHSDTEAREALAQKAAHIEGLRNTIIALQEQLAAKDSATARIQLELAGKMEEVASLSQRVERHDRKYSEKLAVAKEKERILAADLKHLHNYVGKRELEALELAERLEDRETTLAEMSPALAASRRANKLLQVRQEREEAERLEALARYRAKHALKY